MQNVNKKHFTQQQWEDRIKEARQHLEFIYELYELQVAGGRYYVHEHPSAAGSWQEACVVNAMHKHQAWVVRSNMCRFGMVTDKGGVAGLSYKPTDFMTNSFCVADQLDRRSLNMINGQRDHEHVQLESGRPRQAQQYRPELCRAICRGIRDQLHLDKHGLCMVERLDPGKTA